MASGPDRDRPGLAPGRTGRGRDRAAQREGTAFQRGQLLAILIAVHIERGELERGRPSSHREAMPVEIAEEH